MSADGTIPEALHSASTSSWYTPAAIVEAARLALGGTIDLDPASCATANATVQARGFYGEAQDGLAQRWNGAVFVNPPSPPRPWWKKLRGEIEAGRVSKAVFVGYSIETLQQFQDDDAWFVRWDICVPRRRVRYETTALDRYGVLVMRLGKATDAKRRAAIEAQIKALPADPHALVTGEAPAHASVIFGYGCDGFAEAFAPVGVYW